MANVDFSQDTLSKCRCIQCPVQSQSQCAKDKMQQISQIHSMPNPEQVPGVYCATGKAHCSDLNAVQQCLCPGCMVWADYNIHSNHYCARGSAAQTA